MIVNLVDELIVKSVDDPAGGFDRSVQHNPLRRCCYAVDDKAGACTAR
jgi:hypothetical protein